MAFIGKAVTGLVAAFISAFLYGYTLATLWGWFIVPIFGLRGLNNWEAYGASLVFTFMLPAQKGMLDDDPDWKNADVVVKMAAWFIITLIKCGIALIVGYVVKGLM